MKYHRTHETFNKWWYSVWGAKHATRVITITGKHKFTYKKV